MKIAFIGQKGLPAKYGGVENHVEKLAMGLAERGHDVFVYTRPWYTDKNLKEYKDVSLISLPSLKTKHFDAISHTFLCTMHSLFKKYDVIHYHGIGPALMSFLPRIFLRRTKVVVTFHSIDSLHEKWGAVARFFLKLGERFAVTAPHETIAVSKSLQKYCHDKFNVEVVYIPNGASLPESFGDNIVKEKFNLRSKGYLLVAVRLIKVKRIDLLIEAFKDLKTEKRLVIAGGSVFTDDYVNDLKKMAAGDRRIMFTGFQSGEALQQLFENALLFVHPSDSEGLPISVLESMSFGVPTVVSNIPAHLELMPENLRSALVFEKGDAGDLKKKLSSLLANVNTLPNMGQQLKREVIDEFDWQKVIERTEKLYKEIIYQPRLKKVGILEL
ncbi:MAG TPA: glycosyltransferase family 4 protein [Candidatus Bipolaricaulota bacterium]|nr:glycosyltransferase family 4 protein [Candidatus Bipolaricaulota bacterium]